MSSCIEIINGINQIGKAREFALNIAVEHVNPNTDNRIKNLVGSFKLYLHNCATLEDVKKARKEVYDAIQWGQIWKDFETAKIVLLGTTLGPNMDVMDIYLARKIAHETFKQSMQSFARRQFKKLFK